MANSKYWFDYNEIIHNITTGARSFYNGVGSDNAQGHSGHKLQYMAQHI